MSSPSTGPRVALGSFPTPVQELPELYPRDRTTPGAARLFCKREDLSGRIYGGNKVRKLEHLLAELKPGQPILTIGAAGSHHVGATALYGRQRGHPTWALLGPQPDSPHSREQARLSASLLEGWQALRSWSQAPVALARLEWEIHARTGQLPAHIAPGGSSVTGTLGAVDLGLELARDVALGHLPKPDQVFVALGSGGTAAGLWVGLRAAGLDTQVVGVRVAAKAFTHQARIRSLAAATAARLPQPLARPLAHQPLRIVGDYLGRGYGFPVPQGIEVARLARERCGLQLEQTYTAKALAACLDQLRAQEAGQVLVFVNTANSRPLAPLLTAAPAQLPQDLAAALRPADPARRAG